MLRFSEKWSYDESDEFMNKVVTNFTVLARKNDTVYIHGEKRWNF